MHRLYSPIEAMAWVSLFGLAAVSPTVAVSRPEILVHPLVLALVAYVTAVLGALAYAAWNVAVQPRRSAAVLPLMPVLTTLLSTSYSARPPRQRN